MYYYEQRTFDGRISPRSSPDRPTGRGAEGVKIPVENVVKINVGHEGLTLNQLRDVYGSERRFNV